MLATVSAASCSHPSPPAPPPPAVVVAPAVTRNIAVRGEWVASLDGYVNANIQPQVTGYIIAQNYAEGEPAAKDEVLFTIDPRPFQAVLDQARGVLAQARGQVAQAEAQVAQAQANQLTYERNARRDAPEAAANAIPQSQLENDQQAERAGAATVSAAQAQLTAAQAAVQSAQAQVEQAQLNLGFTEVRSLIAGIAGIAQVQIGNLVSPQTVLTAVSQVDPIKAYFPISAQDYLQAVSHAPGVVDLVSPSQAPPLTLLLDDGSIYPQTGHVLFSDREVDPATGTLRVAGAFPNPQRRLRPGQTARVQAVTRRLFSAVLVPQPAVTQLQGKYQIEVVGPDNRVEVRTVEVGPTSGTDWVITRGVAAGERVVVQGNEKVRNGMLVRPQPATANPAPAAATGGQ